MDATAAVSTAAPVSLNSLRKDVKIIGVVATAHMVSHFYFLVLPPLMPLIKAELGISYETLGYGLTMFNLVSMLTQTPVGFLIDRFGARPLLIAGLLLGGLSIAVGSLAESYWLLLAMMGFVGLANCVYHPADYSILSGSVAPQRMGRAFGAHNFAGYVGFAIAPPAMLLTASLWGWRGALLSAGLMGIAIGLMVWSQAGVLHQSSGAAAAAAKSGPSLVGTDLLTSMPILLAFSFYVFTSIGTAAIMSFSVVALQALHGTPLEYGTAALSGFMAAAAGGVAVGGILADRTRHHDRIAAVGLTSTAIMLLVISWFYPGHALIVAVMTGAGFLHGAINPSRDMLVRSITPPGQSGKVFGFVTTGSNLGGMIAPPILGRILDSGDPHWIFWISSASLLLAVFARPGRRHARDA